MRQLLLLTALLISCAKIYATETLEWKKGDTYLKLHGFVCVNTYYDFKNSIDSDVFTVSRISTTEENPQRLGFDPYHTRLGATIGHNLPKVGDTKAVVEVDFRGSSYTVRLRLAYIEIMGFVAGQEWSFFTDTGCNPALLDINGGISRAFFRTQLLGYRRDINENISLGVSIENPVVTFQSLGGEGETISQNTPDIPFYVKYSDSRGHIKAALLVRAMSYGVDSQRNNEFGWGTQLSGNYLATKPLRLYAQAIYGKGIARYINDLNSQSLDLVLEEGTTDQYQGLPMWGAAVGFNCALSSTTSLIGYLSSATIERVDGTAYDDLYHRGLYVGSTLLWKPLPKIELGAGFFYGTKEVMSGESASSNRLISTVIYRF